MCIKVYLHICCIIIKCSGIIFSSISIVSSILWAMCSIIVMAPINLALAQHTIGLGAVSHPGVKSSIIIICIIATIFLNSESICSQTISSLLISTSLANMASTSGCSPIITLKYASAPSLCQFSYSSQRGISKILDFIFMNIPNIVVKSLSMSIQSTVMYSFFKSDNASMV